MSQVTQNDYRELVGVCRSWWRGLNSIDNEGNPTGKPRDRAALAELHRIDVTPGGDAVDIGAALSVPAFQNLFKRLRTSHSKGKLSNARLANWLSEGDPLVEPFAIAAAALARIRDDSGGKTDRCGATAQLLGAARGDGGPDDHLLAEARFKRLIRTRDDWPGLMRQGRRIAAILEREAPVGDLGASLILWNIGSNDPADRKAPNVIRDWAFQYYQREFEPAEPGGEQEAPAASANA